MVSFFLLEQGSPDLKAAKEVADYLGTVHHEFHFTVQVHYTLPIQTKNDFFLFIFFGGSFNLLPDMVSS